MGEQPFPNDDITAESAKPPTKKRSRIGRTVGAIVVAGGVTAAGLAMANQASADPTTTGTTSSTSGTATTPTDSAPAPPDSAAAAGDSAPMPGGPGRGGYRGGPGGFGGPGGLGQALHGELVVAETTTAADGNTTTTADKTIRIQTGAVTAVGDGSLTVLSIDSFSATYTLAADVVVTDVAVGDTVSVQAEVAGDVVTAVRVHEKGTEPVGGWHPDGDADGTRPSGAPTPSSLGDTTAPSSSTAATS